MQVFSIGDNLREMSNPVSGKKKEIEKQQRQQQNNNISK